MPTSSLFPELERAGGLEEQRAIQLAFELSMMGLVEAPSDGPLQFAPSLDDRAKKSQNMTECVPVPSSEHVAEIVGRQGCKIKALRAKTNTYIKTPVRGEEPVFVVTGRKEDVARAKREILSAAEHFSQIRASRKSAGAAPPPPAGAPGHVTAQVRVPYRVVGLVVGPKGATIKRIQHQTHTYIVTPSRDREPVFEVTGLPESVEAARKEIEAHIALRTGVAGGAAGATPTADAPELLASLYRAGLSSLLGGEADAAFSSAGSCSSGGSSARLGDLVGIWSSTERDEGLGESPSLESPAWAWGARPSPAASPARACAVCAERGVAAALVPCGHNLFCLECARRLAAGGAPCPACQAPAHQAIRILS